MQLPDDLDAEISFYQQEYRERFNAEPPPISYGQEPAYYAAIKNSVETERQLDQDYEKAPEKGEYW